VKRALLLAVAFVVLAWPPAAGRYLGSDLIGNVSPESRLGGGLVDRYPLSAYSLDYHVDVGVTDLGGVPPTIAQWAAAQIWSATSFLLKSVVDLFTWAFSLDLLGGEHGALAPVGEAIASVYENVIGEAWMVAAILIAGIWGIWKALVQRRYTDTAGALALSVLFVVVALFFVYQPERTVGEASRWTNTLSLAFLSGANRGSLDDPEQAKRQVADHLFGTLVYRPWVVLEFGGLRHCVDTDRRDDDGFPRPVGPHDPARDVCRDHIRQGRDGYGGYAPRFLAQPAGSDERTAEYEALKSGELPDDDDRQFAGYRVDKSDSPAVDVQQAGGAFQRLTFAAIVFLGALGAVALLGFLSLAVILAQVVALVLLGFAPVALVIGIFPGAGHAFFRGWLTKLATAIFVKALYSLVIAIVVAVSAALTAATDSLGFLFAFGLQTIFFWAIFLYRKQITARLVSATTAAADQARNPRMTVVQRGANIAARPFTALVGVPRSRGGQQSALAGSPPTAPAPAPAMNGHVPNANGHMPAGNGHAPNGDGDVTILRPTPGDPLTKNGSRRHAAALVPLPTPGAAASASPAAQAPETSPPAAHAPGTPPPVAASPAAHPPVASSPAGHPPAPSSPGTRAPDASPRTSHDVPQADASPRASHEDVMRRARELRERQREERGG
jgi:hypothetical protein